MLGGELRVDRGLTHRDVEREFLDAVTQARDEASLDTVRVAALGKKGAISELLKSLGGMSPDERRENHSSDAEQPPAPKQSRRSKR